MAGRHDYYSLCNKMTLLEAEVKNLTIMVDHLNYQVNEMRTIIRDITGQNTSNRRQNSLKKMIDYPWNNQDIYVSDDYSDVY